MAVAEPFARGHAARHALADIARDLGVELVRGALAEVEGGSRVAVTAAGDRLSYDELVVVVGARSEAAFRRAADVDAGDRPRALRRAAARPRGGLHQTRAFLVPPGVAWALPAYELALMTAWQAWSMGQDDVEVMVYTPEEAPLGPFGPRATAALSHDLERDLSSVAVALRQASLRGDADRERFAARRAEARGKTRRTGLAPDVQSRRTTGGK